MLQFVHSTILNVAKQIINKCEMFSHDVAVELEDCNHEFNIFLSTVSVGEHQEMNVVNNLN